MSSALSLKNELTYSTPLMPNSSRATLGKSRFVILPLRSVRCSDHWAKEISKGLKVKKRSSEAAVGSEEFTDAAQAVPVSPAAVIALDASKKFLLSNGLFIVSAPLFENNHSAEIIVDDRQWLKAI